MRKLAVVIVVFGLMGSGCAWLGFGDEETTSTAMASEQQEAVQVEDTAPAMEPVKKESATQAKKAPAKQVARKGAKSEAQIKAELDAMGRKLVNQSARTLLPNAAHKEVTRSGNGWVAKYMHVDTQNVTTEMKPGASGQYVGFIRYQEEIMECRGATREAALQAPCNKVGARRLNELIRYDGNQWQD